MGRSRLLLALVVIGACARRERAPTAAAPDAAPAPAAAAAAPPARTADNRYIGSRACGKCHDKKLARWTRDWHARALSPATPATVAGSFAGTHFKGTSSEAWMERRGGAFVMRTAGPDGATADFPVSWVIGGKRMQDAVAELADGRWQVLPVYFHVTGRAWVDYTEAKQGPLSPDHPFYWTNFRRTANRECLDCHTTGLRVTYDRGLERFATRMIDSGVACESCHGPGGRHADTQEPSDIVHPGKLPKRLGLALCGQCHGPRNPVFPLLDADHRFRPGDGYDDHYQALVVVDGAERSGDYFADGRPKTSSFEYQALLQSRCFRRGEATCLSCHTAPHEASGRNELRAKEPDETCRSCHAEAFARGRAHTHHRASAAQRCVACHMPPVVSGVLDAFADHALDVPAPLVTARHGVPNACNACHAHRGQSPEETAAALARLWPGAAARQARRLRLADAIDEQTRAGSREPLLATIADGDEAPTLRGAAAVLLAQRFPADAAEAVSPLLDDPDPLLRFRAVEALGNAHARALAPLIARLAVGDPSLAVRQHATLVLYDVREASLAEAAARALVADPAGDSLPQPHVLLGIAAGRRGDLAGAERELERAVTLMPYHAEALVMLADVKVKLGRLAEARRELMEALRFAPRHRGAEARLRALPP